MKPHQKLSNLQSPHDDQPTDVRIQNILDDYSSSGLCHQIEVDIFSSLNLHYTLNQITINSNQSLHTILIHTPFNQHKNKITFLTHGFGGTSLMFFPVIKTLLQHGNVVLWEIRGMGLSKKLRKYTIDLQDTQHFFVHPIQLLLKFYSRIQEIRMIGHSFGAYLILLYLKKYKTFVSKIKEVILLSPVGITPKEEDYKSKVQSFKDCLRVVGNKISWLFGLTYKSPFRCICVCLKDKVFGNAVKNCGFDQREEQLMKRLLLELVSQQDGSQSVFFKYFLPRVLPKFPIEPIYINNPPDVNIKIIYGGQEDWVDKKGAQRLRSLYPEKIQLKIIKECGHNFPFKPIQLNTIFTEMFDSKKYDKNLNKIEQKNQQIQQKVTNKIHDLLGHEHQEKTTQNIELQIEQPQN